MATLGQEYKNIEKTANDYKIANKFNAQQKQLRENANSGVSNFSDDVDSKEKQFKQNIKSYKEQIQGQKNKLKSYKTQGKNQLNSLVDLAIGGIDQPGGSDATKEIRGLFIRAIRNTRARVKKIVFDEVKNTIDCNQEQEYKDSTIYIPVQSIDLFGKTLQYSPDTVPGIWLYENKPFNPRTNPTVVPYSFNRELYNRIQKGGETMSKQYGTKFLGPTGQPLFDISYVTKDNNNIDGEFFKVELEKRYTGNKVVEFVGEYYSSIDIVSIKEVYTNVLNALTNSIDFSKSFVDNDKREQTKLEIVIQRILGMCWDNKEEIDVSGVGKLDSQDQIDENLDEFDDLDNLIIDQRVKNFLSGVVEYQDCGNIQLPVTSNSLPKLLDPFNDDNLILTNPDFAAENMLDELANNPEWKAKIPNGLDIAVNKEFLRVAMIALVNTLLSPKHLFPLIVMIKALNNQDSPQTVNGFMSYYRKFLMNLVSKISTIFVEELVKEIKKNYRRIVRDLVNTQAQELLAKQKLSVATIIVQINIGLTLAATIKDYRRCKNVVDELKRLLNLSSRLARLTAPNKNPLWNALAFYKPGITPTAMFVKFLREVGVLGVDTGDMPDGSPNTGVLAEKANNQAVVDEIAENGKVSVALSGAQVAALASGNVQIINIWGTMD